MKKSIKLTALGFAIVTAGLIVSCASENLYDKYIDAIDLIPVQLSKDGKWSMLNSKGELVYEDEFKNRPSMCFNGVFSVEEGEGYTLYKQGAKGPEVLGDAENLKYVGYMSDGLIPVTYPKKRIQMLDAKGAVKFELAPYKGSEIVSSASGYSEGLISVEVEGDKYGYVDKSGNMVIAPTYKQVADFIDGLAVVGVESKDSTSSDLEYKVIDKKGNEVFKINKEYELYGRTFRNGYLYAKNDDRCLLINKKGEITKFPSKVHRIADWRGDYVIFENDEDAMGVCNMEGEVLIRPKYEGMMFDSNDTFFAIKDAKDKEVLRLDKEGKELAKADFESIMPFGKYGYFAKDGKTISMVDADFKSVCKEEFYEISFHQSACMGHVYSEYFNIAGAADALVSMLGSNGVLNVQIGQPASNVVKNGKPSSYTYTYRASIDEFKKEGYRYNISGYVNFSESMAKYDYSSYSYSGDYKWNPDSKVQSITLEFSTQAEWGKDGFDAVVKALKQKGWKDYKVGESEYGSLCGIFTKGKLAVSFQSPKEGSGVSYLIVFSATETEWLSNLAESITSPTSVSKEAKEAEEVVAADSVAAEEVMG